MIEIILNFSKNMTHWIEPFCKKMTQRMFWRKVKKMTQRIEPFSNTTRRMEATAWHVSAPPFCCAPCFANEWWSGDSAGTYSRNVGTTAIWGRRPSFRRLASGCSLQVAEPHQQTEKAVVSFGYCLQLVAARHFREVRHAHRWDLETCVTSAAATCAATATCAPGSRTKCRVH